MMWQKTKPHPQTVLESRLLSIFNSLSINQPYHMPWNASNADKPEEKGFCVRISHHTDRHNVCYTKTPPFNEYFNRGSPESWKLKLLSQNCIMVEAGRVHQGSSSPTSLLKLGHLEQHYSGLCPDGSWTSPGNETQKPLPATYSTFTVKFFLMFRWNLVYAHCLWS